MIVLLTFQQSFSLWDKRTMWTKSYTGGKIDWQILHMWIVCWRLVLFRFAANIRHVILSPFVHFVSQIILNNFFSSSLAGLDKFSKLEDVVLDNNSLTDETLKSLPLLPSVHTLSLNKNKISFYLDQLLVVSDLYLSSFPSLNSL